MVRRKETVEIVNETMIRHRQSFDFSIDELPDLPAAADGEARTLLVPVALLRKERGRFSRFDFTDEVGRTLPLPTRFENAQVSASTLVGAARAVLAGIHPGVEAELRLIASAEKDLALAILRVAYQKPSDVFVNDADAPLRKRLVDHPSFTWLLRTLAYSSILVAAVSADGPRRRILKLSYDEQIADVTRVRAGWRLGARVAAWGYRLGWRGYIGEYLTPYIGARSYHFELHAPPGLELLEAGMTGAKPVRTDRHRVHLYEEHALSRRTAVAYAQFRVRGPGLVRTAVITAGLISVSLWVGRDEAARLAVTNTSAPSLLLLFPGLIASYLARPTHALVTRLLNLARWALLGSAGVAYVTAARLALITAGHPVGVSGLHRFLTWMAAISLVPTALVTASWLLPLRLSTWPRRAWRKIRGKTPPGTLGAGDAGSA
jgi:hypothetical protein